MQRIWVAIVMALALLLSSASRPASAALTQAQADYEWSVHTREEALVLSSRQNQVDTAAALNHTRTDLYAQQLRLNIYLTWGVGIVITVAILLSLAQAIHDFVRNGLQASSIKISKDGIEISSSVMALFVLLAAIYFFQVYIKDVYTIHEQVPPSPPPATVQIAPVAPASATRIAKPTA